METFCYGDVLYGDVLSRRRFVRRRFVCAPYLNVPLPGIFSPYFAAAKREKREILQLAELWDPVWSVCSASFIFFGCSASNFSKILKHRTCTFDT
jgi:hypothetical protein